MSSAFSQSNGLVNTAFIPASIQHFLFSSLACLVALGAASSTEVLADAFAFLANDQGKLDFFFAEGLVNPD